ncbi:flagellar hook-associated protein FlgL [Calorimonas adulescens]|uniref:Flagellar hook-associated protein FlgL n=1 Tax=Calorimonas adulescens TaxID=2606906 RepID=A0A5D8QF71_9THEO|nr:flagellar hook-associated protein FlgL [Calorimonas adulescens]TZE83142.1 flagellar hook-associated protein FlgL [Calorimonas adulescens]
MRVTNNMMINNFLINLNKNTERMDRFQRILASGKLIQYPSDDPVGTVTVMKLKKDVSSIDQYQKNVDDANSWLELTDTSLSNITDILNRIRELAVQGSNGTNSPSDTQAIASELVQLKEQLVNIGNTRYSDRFIFGGMNTTSEVYTLNSSNPNGGVDYNGSDNGTITGDPWKIEFNVGANDRIPINITGKQIFGDTTTPDNIFKLIDDIVTKLNAGDTNAVSSYIEDIDNYINNILSIRADIGARMNRVELTKNRLSDDQTNFTNLLSKAEDADIAKVIMDLTNAENVYTASLNVGARIIQPSLVDFLD